MSQSPSYRSTRPWSTPLTIASALVVAISGVIMFFHLGDSLVKGAHEWIGMLFVIAMVLHILQHWPAFRRYFAQRKGVIVISAVLLASTGFVAASALSTSKHPAHLVVDTVLSLPLEKVAVINDITTAQLQQQLDTAGISADNNDTLAALAHQHQRHPFELLALVFDNTAND
ncbi:MAG: DUF4405 domain-containing protein [Marinobacterium sp.]|nr:DUF4405 domain-containing protein [Marinobacterium sp.]